MNKKKSRQSSQIYSSLKQLITPLQHTLESQESKRIPYPKSQLSNECHQDQARQSEETVLEESEKVSQVVSNMIQKNKINSKNAFQIPIIDVSEMRVFWRGDDGAWSKVSSSLENSSKIYGYRVDSVSESINKLTSSMNRSVQVQSKKQISQQMQALNGLLDCSYQNGEYNQQKIQIHLQQGKLNNANIEIRQRCELGDEKIRRIMDQNGVSALILANVPILGDLSIGILGIIGSKGNYQSKQIQQKIIILPNAKFKLEIVDQISRIMQGLPTRQTTERDEAYLEWNTISQFLDRLSTNNSQVKDYNMQRNSELITWQQEIEKWQGEYEKELSTANLAKRDEKGKNKKKTMQKKRQHTRKTKNRQMLFQFQLSLQLSKQNVLKVSKGSFQGNLNCTQNQNFYNSFLSAFEVSTHLSFHASHLNQDQQKKESCLLQNILEEAELTTSAQNLGQVQFNQKVAQIRQTKHELYQILTRMWGQEGESAINFSELSKIHREFNQNCIEVIDFVSILHLCNQVGLCLKQAGNYDFTICRI